MGLSASDLGSSSVPQLWCHVGENEFGDPDGTHTASSSARRSPVLVGSERIETLLGAFQYCDPQGTGYIKDHAKFAAVAQALARLQDNQSELWKALDQDGNGKVSFAEFVEWADRFHVRLPLGMDGDAERGPGGISFPHTWRGPRDDPSYTCMALVEDGERFAYLQQLLDVTYKKVWTRDRKATGVNDVPTRFELARAESTENASDWRRYYLKRHHIVHDCMTAGWLDKFKPLTAQAVHLCTTHRLRSESCNEWFLFHGTTTAAAKQICSSDFTMTRAGAATGTLYGRGTYFAESITKADEYAKPDDEGLCCVLLCRVVGGRVFYCDEPEPDAQTLQDSVLDGRYNSVLGDRERCRGTFKEYVVFDADQVYVEYALYYRRIYA
uniref:Poly [ADP-ribose] polymerase n=1 Tax=Zooxanthella nutricula TaxID=1333877 RepID=A0A7S2QJS3_9DINO